jgi:hypothetical protein
VFPNFTVTVLRPTGPYRQSHSCENRKCNYKRYRWSFPVSNVMETQIWFSVFLQPWTFGTQEWFGYKP